MKKRNIIFGLSLIIILLFFSTGCLNTREEKNLPPIVSINAKPEIYSNTTFIFNVYVEDPDGNVLNSRHQWDFENDGIIDWDSIDIDNELNIENGYYKMYHFYSAIGECTAILKVIDENGMATSEICNIEVISHSLSISASLNKNAYFKDETILLTIGIQNAGTLSINVSEMDLNYPTLGDSEIQTPDEYIIKSMMFVNCMPPEITIHGNSLYTKTLDLLDYTFGIWDGETWTEYNLTKRGKYSIKIFYDSYPNGEVWNGVMITETITFIII